MKYYPKMNLLFFLFFYGCVLAYVWLSSGLFSPWLNNNIPTQMPITSLCGFFKGGDIGAYCSVGHDLAIKGSRAFAENMGEFTFWPPGQFLNFALGAWILGNDAALYPYFLTHIFILWLSVFIVIGYFAGRSLGLIGYFFPLLLLPLPEFSNFLLKVGLYGSDGYGTAIFVFSFAVLLFKRNLTVLSSLLCGVLLVISAYYRSMNESIILLMLVAFLSAFCYKFIQMKIKGDKISNNIALELYNKNKYLLYCILFAITLTIPWRVFTYNLEQRISWTRNIDFEIHSSWYAIEDSAPWFLDSGGALACKFDPITCEKFHQKGLQNVRKTEKFNALMKVVGKDPFKWFVAKLNIFVKQWISPYYIEKSRFLDAYRLFLMMIFFIYPIVIFINFLFSRVTDMKRTILIGSSFVMSIVLITLVHIEPRYLYMSKILAIVYVLDMLIESSRFKLFSNKT